MTTHTVTRPTTPDVRATEVSVPTTAAGVRAGRLSALRAAIRTRRAQRSELSRQIAAYPATRGVATPVLPSSRFWV